jgi:hypothetical protein
MAAREQPDDAEQAAYKEEAARLRLLNRLDQIDMVHMVRQLARSPKLSPAERQAAKRRAEALSRLLKIA